MARTHATVGESVFRIRRLIRNFFLVLVVSTWLIIGGFDAGLLILVSAVTAVICVQVILRISAVTTSPQTLTGVAFSMDYRPLVSVHVACSSEPAKVVNQTLKHLSLLKYENYEVIVIHNNNKDHNNWEKIQAYCYELGAKFKFFHVGEIDGFKAGALNYAYKMTDPKTEIIAVVDSDYLVNPDFLERTVGFFTDPKVGIVQAPQDYLDTNSRNNGLVLEYRSFFSLIMNQSQALNAVTFTGTMGLLRAELFKRGLAWNEWCITEDTEAGMHFHALGYHGVFVDTSLGKGLMPFDYSSLIVQRERWTYGNMQILRRNCFALLFKGNLTMRQRYGFLVQLFAWLHFELLLTVAYACLMLSELVGATPSAHTCMALLIISLALELVSMTIFFVVGLRREQSSTFVERMKALLTHLGLLGTMSWGWMRSYTGPKLRFKVTSKDKVAGRQRKGGCTKELAMPVSLLILLCLRIVTGAAGAVEEVIILLFSLMEILGIYSLSKMWPVRSARFSKSQIRIGAHKDIM